MTITAQDVKPNSFLDNLKTDFIAVDANGNILARADSEEVVRKAAPDTVAVFTGKDFETKVAKATVEPVTESAGEAIEPVAAEESTTDNPVPGADGSAFDHDDDGKVGGSKKKSKAKSAT
jgi:hypothetical protein